MYFHFISAISPRSSQASPFSPGSQSCSRSPISGALPQPRQALLTPAISHGPPSLPFIHFFVQHFAIVAAALYIPLVLKWRPKAPWWRSPLEVFGISIAYHCFSLAVNALLETNFAFASRPPDNPSLIDHLGPWPVYLFAMQGIALLLYLALALPLRKSN